MATRNRLSWILRLGFLTLIGLIALWLSACGGASPQIVVEPATQNLGEVPQQPLELSYTVRNQGGSPLQIEKISTSCGCTEAAVDQESIPPGESTQLRVTLDPTEDDLYGNLVRVITIRSNDPKTPEAEAKFHVTIRRTEG